MRFLKRKGKPVGPGDPCVLGGLGGPGGPGDPGGPGGKSTPGDPHGKVSWGD